MNLPQNLAAINWTFGQPFNSIKFVVDIPQFPLDSEGNPSNKGIYFQLYDQRINNTGTYFGLQTNLVKQVAEGYILTGQFGGFFTRWETRDNDCLRIADEGFPENADHEKDFIGVRMPIDFIPGKYIVELKSGKIEQDGVWYDLTVEHDQIGKIDCGGLKFPLVNGEDIGFQDGGGAWVELYRTTEDPPQINENDIPMWKVIVESVLANDSIAPTRATLAYPFKGSNGLSYVYETADRSFVFEIGSTINRLNLEGPLF